MHPHLASMASAPPLRLASLPMYPAAGAQAHQRLWAAIAAQLRARGVAGVPSALSDPASVPAPARPASPGATLQEPADALQAHWRDPRLLLSQACGYPFLQALRAEGVQLVGAFRYAAPGCAGTRYRSALVCRSDDAAQALVDLRGRVAAINARDSQSGCNALGAAIAALPAPDRAAGDFFRATRWTGAHAASMECVRTGAADLAAIDAVTWATLQRHRPEALDGLRILGWTPSAPGLPLITARTTRAADLAALRDALSAVMQDTALAAERADMLVAGFEVIDAQAYEEIARMEAASRAAGVRWPA